MTITHVQGIAASRGSGSTLETFDIMGVAIVDEADFRKFDSADGSWPIVFRSDTRPYSEIFGKGFWPRADAADRYLGGSSLTGRRSVALRLGNMDLDKDTAVCVSRVAKMTALFPFDRQKSFGEEDVKIYICQVKSWLEVCAIQDVLAPKLAYAQEVAVTGIDPMDVLGCFRAHRKWKADGVEFEVTSMDPNPAARRSVPDSVKEFAGGGRREVAAPGLLEEKAYGSADGSTVFGYTESLIRQLTGDAARNRAANSRVGKLTPASPIRATRQRRGSGGF